MSSPVYKWTAEQTGLHNALNAETLTSWQNIRLVEVIDYAVRNTRFYRDRIKGFSNLNELPFTRPEDIAADPLAFLAIPQNSVARITTLANSGTTYLKKRVFFSDSDLERTRDFFSAGMSTFTNKGDHVAILISNKTENSLGSLLSQGLERRGVSSVIAGAIKGAEKAAEAARGSDCLVGMPSEMLYLCRKYPELRPKKVLLAADIAPAVVIKNIAETWNCDVFVHYGHTEFGYGCAVDCPAHDGLHLRDAGLIFEIINPDTLKPSRRGEAGEIVITTLASEAMPLIRYRTGNISRFIDTPCGCGGLLPRLEIPRSRNNNIVVSATGKSLNIYQIDEALYAEPSVMGFNVAYNQVQNTLELSIESKGKIDISRLESILPNDTGIEVKYEKTDPFCSRGKRRIRII